MCCIRNKEKSNLQLSEKVTDFFTVIDSQVDTQMDTVKNIQWNSERALKKKRNMEERLGVRRSTERYEEQERERK